MDEKGTVTINDDVIVTFSSRGPIIDSLLKPDLVTHGVNITSLLADTSYCYHFRDLYGNPDGNRDRRLAAPAKSRLDTGTGETSDDKNCCKFGITAG